MSRFFEGTHWRKCVASWLDRCCMLTQVCEICLCFSAGMSMVCCCWVQMLMLLSSETEWGFPAFWWGGRGCSASGWCDKPHKHFNECCLGQRWKSQFLILELSEHLPWKGALWKKCTYMSQTDPFTHTGPRRTQWIQQYSAQGFTDEIELSFSFCLPFFCWPFEVSQNGSPIQ